MKTSFKKVIAPIAVLTFLILCVVTLAAPQVRVRAHIRIESQTAVTASLSAEPTESSVAFANLSAVNLQSSIVAETVKIVDFSRNARGREPNSKLSSLEGATDEEIAEARAYVAGGKDLENIYSLEFGDKLGAEELSAGCKVISQGGRTGDLFVSQGKLSENGNDEMLIDDDYPSCKDYESFNLKLKVENFIGIEKIYVRIFDFELFDYIHQSAAPADSRPLNNDIGYEMTFTTNQLKDGWCYLEADLTSLTVKDSMFMDRHKVDGKSAYFLNSIEGGIKGNRPSDSKPMKASYVQVVTMFNERCNTAVDGQKESSVLFDDFNLSTKSVNPKLTAGAIPAGTTGSAVDMAAAFTAEDNRTAAENLNYSMNVSFGGNALSTKDINGLKFTPYLPGEYSVEIVASDEDRNVGKLSLKVNVTGEAIDRVAPEINSAAINEIKSKSPFVDFSPIDLSSITATDSMDKNPTITFSVKHESGATFDVVDKKFTPTKNGIYTIYVKAVDASLNDVTKSFNISVENPNAPIDNNTDEVKGCGGCGSVASLSGGGALLAISVAALTVGSLIFVLRRRNTAKSQKDKGGK